LRTLFLLLLLANLLFLAWTRWVVVPGTNAPVPAARSQPGTTPIKLRHEVRGAESSPQAEAMAGSTEPPLEATCVSIGPFVEPAAVEAAAGRLQRLGFLARSRSSVDEVRVGLWVRVPSLPTPEDAANALAALQAAGLSDAYVVSDGSPGNTVSLGVFGDRARAEQVAETVRKAGYTPETSDRLRTMDVFWLDIDRQANGGLPALDAVEPEPGAAGLPLEMRACPGAVASGATPTVDAAAEPS
jgi:hypothetical protein